MKTDNEEWKRSQNELIFVVLFDVFSMSVLKINPANNDFLRNHFMF